MFKSIKVKLSLLLSVLLIFSILASLVATNQIVENHQRDSLMDALGRTEQVVNTLLAAQRFSLLNQSNLVGILPILATVVENGDTATILDSAKSYQQQLQLPVFDVLNVDGDLMASVMDNSPDVDNTQSIYLKEQALEEGLVLASLMVRQQQLALIATAPIGLPDEPSGVLMVGSFLDHDFAKKIKNLTKAEISFIVDNKVTGSSLTQAEQNSLLQVLQLSESSFSDQGNFLDIGSHLLSLKPLKDIDSNVIGQIVIQFSLSEAVVVLQHIRSLLLTIGAGIFFMAIIIGYFFTLKTIINPVRRLQEDADQLSQGNLDHSIDVSHSDELGNLARSFSHMRDAIRNKISDLHILNTVGEMLAALHDEDEALKLALSVMKTHTNVLRGSVYLLKGQQLNLNTCYPDEEIETCEDAKSFKLGEGIAGKAAQQKRIIFIPDTSKDPEYIDRENVLGAPKSLLCVPMFDDNCVFGVMNFSGEVGKVNFNVEDYGFALTIARMTMVATVNIQMVHTIEVYSHHLENKVQERTAAIKDLMDSTGQGFFTFGSDYLISKEYSKPCQVFFDGTIEELDGLDLLFGTPLLTVKELREKMDDHEDPYLQRDKDNREIFDMIFCGTSDLEILRDLLPKEIVLNGRMIALEYKQLKQPDSTLKIMMILTDITKERELAMQMAADEELNATILKVALDKDGFLQMVRELENLFGGIFSVLEYSPSEIDINELFRYYHTIKGGSATYSLQKVAEKAHAIEDSLEHIRIGEKLPTQQVVDQLLQETKELQRVFQLSLKDLGSLISTEELQQAERTYRIRASKFDKFCDTLRAELPNNTLVLVQEAIKELCQQPIGPMLQKYATAARGLAESLNKPVNIEIKGQNVDVSYERLEFFLGSLVHLVRNAVDHGLEDSQIRLMLQKPDVGTINIEAQANNGELKFIIADDGGGIDAEAIKNIALEKAIIDANFVESASADDLLKLIFAPGFSTKEEVTDISGRGVGMDAVKAAVEELQGEINIITQLGQGSTFEISIPHER